MGNDKRNRFERERALKLKARLASIIVGIAAVVTVIGYISSLSNYRRIESTMNYENADTTEIVKLVNDMNEMYENNRYLRDSIYALNNELDYYRSKYGPIKIEPMEK